MHRKDLFIYDCCNGQAIEAVRERLPELDVVPPLAFIVEPINAVNRSTLMVSTQNEEILRVFDFICK